MQAMPGWLGPDGEILGGGGDVVPGLIGAQYGMYDYGYGDLPAPDLWQADWGSFGGGYSNAFSPSIDIGYGGGGLSVGTQIPGSGINVGVTIPTGGGGGYQPNVKELLTSIVNSYEAALKTNLASWQAQQISGEAALEKGWAILNEMVVRLRQYPPNGELAAAQRDRRINPALLKWDYIAYYLDPITGGPSVLQPLPTGSGGVTPGVTIQQPFGVDPITLVLIGLAVFLVLKR